MLSLFLFQFYVILKFEVVKSNSACVLEKALRIDGGHGDDVI